MAIHHGDQYSLPVKIMNGDNVLTPQDVTDVRIKIGDNTKTSASGEVTYDDETQNWLYPITETETRGLSLNGTFAQVGVKFGNDIVYSDITRVSVAKSIIEGAWGGG